MNRIFFIGFLLSLGLSFADWGPTPIPSQPLWMYVLDDIDGNGRLDKLSFLTMDLYQFGSIHIGNDVPGNYTGDYVGLRYAQYIVSSEGNTLLDYGVSSCRSASLVSSDGGSLTTMWLSNNVELTRKVELNLERCLITFTIKNIGSNTLKDVKFYEIHRFDDYQYEFADDMILGGQVIGENYYYTHYYPLFGMVYAPAPDTLDVEKFQHPGVSIFNLCKATFALGDLQPNGLKSVKLSIVWSNSSDPQKAKIEVVKKMLEQKKRLREIAGQDIKIIETIPNKDIAYISNSFSEAPSTITTEDNKSIMEWEYDRMCIDEIKAISFYLILSNLTPGEDRMVNEGLKIIYTDFAGSVTSYTIPSQYVHVYKSAFDIELGLERDQYYANSEVIISSLTVTSHAEFPKTLTCSINVEDNQGIFVASLGTLSIKDLLPHKTIDLTSYAGSWNTKNTLAGSYSIHAILYEEGKEITDTRATFTIINLPLEKGVKSFVTCDKISYPANSNVTILSKVKSLYLNTILDLSLSISINGFTSTFTLSPQSLWQGKSYWNTGTHTPGEYLIEQAIFYGTQCISIATCTFTIISTGEDLIGIKGDIDVTPHQVKIYGSLTFDYQVNNTGNVDLFELELNILIVDPETKELKYVLADIVTITKGGSYTNINVLENILLKEPKEYLAILQAKKGTITKSLDFCHFKLSSYGWLYGTVTEAKSPAFSFAIFSDKEQEYLGGGFPNQPIVNNGSIHSNIKAIINSNHHNIVVSPYINDSPIIGIKGGFQNPNYSGYIPFPKIDLNYYREKAKQEKRYYTTTKDVELPQNNGVTMVETHGGKIKFSGNKGGSGTLIVIGADCELEGSFKFQGLIYIIGSCKISGNINIYGQIIVKDKITISGNSRIYYFPTHIFLPTIFPKAIISLIQDNKTIVTTTTSLLGTYSIPHLPPGTYTVLCEALGYYPQIKTTTIYPQTKTELEFSLILRNPEIVEIYDISRQMVRTKKKAGSYNYQHLD